MGTMGFFRPSYARRALNRLTNNEGPAAAPDRPDNDAGYDQLCDRLLECLRSEGTSENPPMHREPAMNVLLRQREFGHRLPSVAFQRGMQRAMLLNKNRAYQLCETYETRGLLNVFGPIMLSHKHRLIFDLELAEELCSLPMVRDQERIITSLLIEFPLENTAVPASASPDWLITLTSQGRVLILNLKDGTSVAEFQLPINVAKFSSMYPNEANKSFSVYGQMLPMERVFEPRRTPNAESEYVIAMFNLHPLTFTGMFKMPKEIFGCVVNVNVIGEMVIVFRKKPHEVIIYQLGDLRNRFTQHVYQPGEFADGSEPVPFSVFVVAEPAICSRIPGNWSTLEYSGFPYHFLGTPSNGKTPFKLMDAAQRKNADRIDMPEGFCERPPANASLVIDDTSMFFLADESGRILRFEGPMLVSYDLRKHSGVMKISEQWRTNVWVGEAFLNGSARIANMFSSSGRRIVPPQGTGKDYRMTIKGVEYSPDLQVLIVAALCDLRSPIFDDPLRPYDAISRRNAFNDESDMCILAYVIDATTGNIIKTSIMRQNYKDTTQFQLDALDAGLTFLQKERKGSGVEVQRLQEIGVKEWENPGRRNTLKDSDNGSYGRERRNRRRAAANADLLLHAASQATSRAASGSAEATRPASPRIQRRRRRLFGEAYDEDEDSDYVPPGGDNSN